MEKLRIQLTNKPILLNIFAGLAAFFTYLTFYPFRRAYTAASFDNIAYWGINFKILMITAQVLGFTVSKGFGIKIVSEIKPNKRAQSLIALLFFSFLCYVGFGFCPRPFNLILIFFASLPLGLVYGIVLGFLEGRKTTDLLVAILTASFILGSGFAKSLGKWIIADLGINEFWMPAVASGIMMVPFAISVGMLALVPPPNQADEELRTVRQPMNKADRLAFLEKYSLGIFLFVSSYVLLTIFREFRDNFTPEIWKILGRGVDSKIFTQTEIPIAITILLLMASFRWLKSNQKAFYYIQIIMIFGGVLVGGSTLLFQFNYISPVVWFISTGLGAYMAYSMSNSLYFERMIATFKIKGTIGFLITFADFFAYFGSIIILFYKNYFQTNINYLQFFIYLSYSISVLYVLFIGSGMWYFNNKQRFGINKNIDNEI